MSIPMSWFDTDAYNEIGGKPIGRSTGSPEEIASTIEFLCKPQTCANTGTFLHTLSSAKPTEGNDMDYSQDIIMIMAAARHWAATARRLGKRGKQHLRPE